jgi:hypothetical protein
VTRHKKRSGLTNYRRKKKHPTGSGAKVRSRRRSWWEKRGIKVPTPDSFKTPCTEGVEI